MLTGSAEGAGLIKYDAQTGQALETVQFSESDPDPHGLAWRDGARYSLRRGDSSRLAGEHEPGSGLHLSDRPALRRQPRK